MATDIYELLRKASERATSSTAPTDQSWLDAERAMRMRTGQMPGGPPPATWAEYRAQQAARAARAVTGTGVVPTAAPAASAAIRTGSILTKPISSWGALKSAGKAIISRPMGAAALIAPATGALASKMAGGSALEGAVRPDLLTNALGEGYARYAPRFMGGFGWDAEGQRLREAAVSEKASDIEGRFDSPVATIPVTKSVLSGNWGAIPDIREGAGSSTIIGERPSDALSRLPPVVPFTAEDIRGSRVPVSGTGAFVNNQTGEVTNLDTRALTPSDTGGYGVDPTAYAPTLASLPSDTGGYGADPTAYAPTRYRERIPTREDVRSTPAGRFFGASMNLKRIAGDQARTLAEKELTMKREIAADTVGVARNKNMLDWLNAQANMGGKQITVAQKEFQLNAAQEYLRANPGDFGNAVAIAAGRAPAVVTPSFGAVAMVMPDPKTGAIPVENRRTGEITLQIPKPAPRTASAADFVADVKRFGSKAAVLAEYAKRNITPPKE